MHEEWFIALAILQKKQDDIDRKEMQQLGYTAGVSIYGKQDIPIVSAQKSVGRPPTDWRLVNEVLRLYDESIESERSGEGKRLSLRALQRAMSNKVKYLTIRKILQIYRRHTYKRKD